MKKLIVLLALFSILVGCAPKVEEGISQKKAEEIALEDLKLESNMEHLNEDGVITPESLEILDSIKDKKYNVWIVTITSDEEEPKGKEVAQYKIDLNGKIISKIIL
ncbi:hypothetical protein ACOI1C_13600 [Bacillus sp. DJP31]|uniref:hypothetical protein n=1 Tax=Bacillus sp. DJP31 TaxID=3409789 RepID=UPI003BB70D55